MRILIPVLLLILLAGTSHAQPTDPPAPAQFIVRLSDDAPQDVVDVLSGLTAKSAPSTDFFRGVVASRPALQGGGATEKSGTRRPAIPAYTVTVTDSSALEQLMTLWSGRDDVRYVEANDVFELDGARAARKPASVVPGSQPSASDTPRLSPANILADSLDHLRVVRADAAWPVTSGRSDVRVGIVDSGIYLRHPDLQPTLWVNAAEDLNGNGRLDAGDLNGIDDDGNGTVDDVVGYDFVDQISTVVEGEFQDRDPDPSPDSLNSFSIHGTAVAGVAAASAADTTRGVYGVAPGVRVVPLRAFNGLGFGETDDIAAAIVYAADTGIDVLNFSFGRDFPSPLLQEAIQYAAARGVVMTASAGNSATQRPHFPSDYPEVLSTLWLAEDGEGVPQRSSSQFGVGIDIGAPGSRVYTTQYPRSALLNERDVELDDLYGPINGSSFAAPQVAGAAALLKSLDATLTPASIRSILTSTAADLGQENWDHTTGAGRLDVAAAVAQSVPARTALDRPGALATLAGNAPVAIVGSSVDPQFRSYALSYAAGDVDLDQPRTPWIEIQPPTSTQVLADTLGTWDVTTLADSTYTLRLVTTLTTGRTIEVRRRIRVDRTPPVLSLDRLEAGLLRDEWGLVGDVFTDDPTRKRIRVRLNGEEVWLRGEFLKRRGAFAWPDASGQGGTADVMVEAEDTAGRVVRATRTVDIPRRTINRGYVTRMPTNVPRGRLLKTSTDFDRDGLREIVFNEFDQGGPSDSVRVYEWGPDGFALADSLVASFLPKDVGDTDQNGRAELLLQVSAATLLLEQAEPTSPLPSEELFFDREFLNDPSDSLAFFGTRLTDFDGDGQGEILGKRKFNWVVRERTGDAFPETIVLENPTSGATLDSSLSSNVFGTNVALPGDFDQDGRRDFVAGDRDGDLMIFESTGDDRMAPVWTFETDRVDAGTRFGSGDFNGDGVPEFVSASFFYPLFFDGVEPDAPIALYSVWETTGDNAYRRDFQLPIAGAEGGNGSITTADLDADGRDELVLVHPPSLYILDRAPTSGWEVVYHTNGMEGTPGVPFSRNVVADDFDGDGRPELVLSTTADTMARFVVNPTAQASPVPQWSAATPTGSDGVRLAWLAPEADSVTVFDAAPDGAFDPRVTVTGASEVVLEETAPRRYALRSWVNEEASPLSPARTVRPHAPARVASVEYPTATSVRLIFTEPLDASTAPEQFALGPDAIAPVALLPSAQGRAAVLRFAERPMGTLRWTDVTDASGLAVAQTEVVLEGPKTDRPPFVVETITVRDERRLALTFEAPLADDASAQTLAEAVVKPAPGQVVDVQAEDDRTLVLRFDGIVIGATGIPSSVDLPALESRDGAVLAEESRTVRLDRAATSLDGVIVYPNPYRAARHGSEMTIAGLPTEATIRIYSPEGRLVQVLTTPSPDGAQTWDLRDRRGQRVPSGVYLVRVEAPGETPVLRKAAVIQ